MTEHDGAKQVWTTPSLETLDMKATQNGFSTGDEPETGGEGGAS